MISEALFNRYYDHPRYDGTSIFYAWVRAHLRPDFHILNLGAGPATGSRKRVLRGDVERVVGADIDPVVFDNTELDEAVLIHNDRLPIADAQFDLIYADFVLEHVERPAAFLAEALRVLKPGGSFFFRTPNRFHYVAIIAALTPHSVHLRIANRVRGLGTDVHDPWPTFYRLNTPRTLRRLSRSAGFSSSELRLIEAEPSYLMFHPAAFLAGVGYERLVNSSNLFSGLRSTILGRLWS